MEEYDPIAVDERSWYLTADEDDFVYLCFSDTERVLISAYEHDEEETDCVMVMLFK